MNKAKAVGSGKGSALRRSAAQWKLLVDEQRRSGMTQVAFCAREGISPMSLSNWRRRFDSDTVAAEVEPSFIEVGRSEPSGTEGVTLRLELGAGIVLTVTRGR